MVKCNATLLDLVSGGRILDQTLDLLSLSDHWCGRNSLGSLTTECEKNKTANFNWQTENSRLQRTSDEQEFGDDPMEDTTHM